MRVDLHRDSAPCHCYGPVRNIAGRQGMATWGLRESYGKFCKAQKMVTSCKVSAGRWMRVRCFTAVNEFRRRCAGGPHSAFVKRAQFGRWGAPIGIFADDPQSAMSRNRLSRREHLRVLLGSSASGLANDKPAQSTRRGTTTNSPAQEQWRTPQLQPPSKPKQYQAQWQRNLRRSVDRRPTILHSG